jgi:Xaa-Pro aminopeptidase
MNKLKSCKYLFSAFAITCALITLSFLHSFENALPYWKEHYFKVTDECPSGPYYDKLYLENRIKFSKELNDSTEFIIAAALRPVRVNTDTDYPGYRQESNIIYLLGINNISPSLLHVKWNGTLVLTLLIPEMSQRDRIFGGDLLDKESLKRIYDLDDVVDISTVLNLTEKDQFVQTISPIQDINVTLGPKLLEKLDSKNVTFVYNSEIVEAFYHSRFTKSLKEIQMIGYATKIAKWAHQRLAQIISLSERVSEMDLVARFNHYTLKCGGRLSAYNPIIGFGIDSATLHFRTGENETRGYQNVSPKSNFILIDAAPEYKGYASDITRTIYPMHSARHALIYDIVFDCQQAAISNFRIGRLWTDVEERAYKSLTTSLLQHQFFLQNYSVAELLLEKAYTAFMPHGLGHPVGLDVHDPVPKNFGKRYRLDNGIVHTIEV